MKGFVHRVILVVGCVAMCAGLANAQTPGIVLGPGAPGDGVLDVYYNTWSTPLSVMTSLGEFALEPGTLVVDTDGNDMVALFIGGPNVATTGCSLCEANNLPGAMPNLSDFSTWTVGYSAGSTQWIRGAPLSGNGFRGVTTFGFLDGTDTQQPWPADVPPFLNFPDAGTGIANYGMGLGDADFSKVLNGNTNSVQWAADTAAGGFTDVSIVTVPEPSAGGLLGLGGLALLGIIRRRL